MSAGHWKSSVKMGNHETAMRALNILSVCCSPAVRLNSIPWKSFHVPSPFSALKPSVVRMDRDLSR